MPRIKNFKVKAAPPLPTMLSGTGRNIHYDPGSDTSRVRVTSALQLVIKELCLRNSSQLQAEEFLVNSESNSDLEILRQMVVAGDGQDKEFKALLRVAQDLVGRSHTGRRERMFTR